MPELPEVETMRRGILPIARSRIEAIHWPRTKLKPITTFPDRRAIRRRVLGRKVVDVDRVGKRVVLRLEGGDALVFEPRMTGLVLVTDPPDDRYVRLHMRLAGRRIRKLLYWDRRGLGSVKLLSPPQFQAAFGPERLGPDALSITGEQLRDQLGESRREIKVALLDQRALAGIGNLYAAEILHMAGIHPQRRCDRLTRRDWGGLHAAMVEVLEEAIHYEGSTLSDGTYRNALNRAGGYQNEHRVYQRAGQQCLTCQADRVFRIVQAQRSTFFCPNCQPR